MAALVLLSPPSDFRPHHSISGRESNPEPFRNFS